MKFQLITLVFLLYVLTSCVKNTELENALEMAGSNRSELEKVLNHYRKNPADSLKLRAAEFLISNMIYHHTFENTKLKDYYAELIKLNNDTIKAANCKNKYDSLAIRYKIESKDLKIKYDIQSIKAEYLIKNIDQAIHHWYKNPWTQHLTFADFCEYVLPYRIGNENLEEWRENLATKYLKKLDWINNVEDSKNSTYWASRHLTDSLKSRGYHIYSYKKQSSINHPPTVLENIKLGPCDDYAQSTTFIMRACGIPVCIDFTPQWPNRSMGHTWNVLFDESGKEIPFMGGESAPGYPNRPGDVMAKVFRKTYSYQNESLFHIKRDEEVPDLFNTPFIKDVTCNYYNTVNVELELVDKTKKRFAYLAVFDNSNWIPVQWGEVKNNKTVNFKALGKNCMYLPILYIEGVCKPAGKPFFINSKSEIKIIKSIFNDKHNMKLTRKYPVKRSIYIPSRRVIGTTIEASNNDDFTDSICIGKIKRDPKFDWDTLNNSNKQRFRYWRLKGNKKSMCSFSEIQFIYRNKNVVDTSFVNSKISETFSNKAINTFDNDKLTYIELKQNSNEWIEIDFGKPVAVDYFWFLPRNDDNAIVAGDNYELMMWSDAGWKSLIKCIATSNQLVFKNVPSGGLYLLHNHTKGKEERIFTYENGKQVWW